MTPQQVSLNESLESVSILHDKGESMLQVELRLLIHWPWNEEIILDYLGGPNLIRDPFKREAGEEAKLWWHKVKKKKKKTPQIKRKMSQ